MSRDRPRNADVELARIGRESCALTERLADWAGMAQGAFSANTRRAWKADWEIFVESCRAYQLESLPASPKTVRAFVFECLGKGKKPATVRRYVSTIGRAHRASGVADPTASEDVKLALKEMGRNVPARQKQARGLTWAEIEVFLSIEPRNLRDVRDRALVAVAYDTMCRREELVSLLAEDISQSSDGSASILIRRSKTDASGEGATAYLSPLTMRLLSKWIREAGIKEGPIFVRVLKATGTSQRTNVREASQSRASGSPSRGEGTTPEQPGQTKNSVGAALTAQNVASILRKVGKWIGLDKEEWQGISGHSARVGAAQDLLALNMDLPSVMQAGRWMDTRMPMRYGEKVLAGRGAMARAAKAQGRI